MKTKFQPSASEIERETARGHSYESAVQIVTDRATTKNDRLKAVAPTDAKSLDAADAEAQKAKDKADKLRAAKEFAVGRMDAALKEYGRAKSRLALFSALVTTDEQRAALAESAFDALVTNAEHGSPFNASAANGFIALLIERTTLQPHLAGRIEKQKLEIIRLSDGIKELARDERIEIAPMVKAIRADAEAYGNREIIAWIDSGFFNDLVN